MQGFHPELHMADGGVVGFLKRATGLAPKLYPSAKDEQRQQQEAQQAQQQAQAPKPEEPKKALSQYSGMSALKRREKEAGFKDGGRVRPQGFVASDKHPDGIDTVPARLTKGEYVLPTDTVDAVGVENLDALRAATHTPARGFSGEHEGEFFFAGGGGVDDEERKRGNPGLTTVDDPVANAARFVKVPPPIGTQPGRQVQAQQPPAQPAPVTPPAVQPAAPVAPPVAAPAPQVQRQPVAAPVASGQPAATAPQPRPRTFTEDVIMTAGDNAKAAWDRGGASGVGEAFGHAVRGAATAIPAAFVDAADDVVNGPIGNTVGGFWRGITGGSDQPTQQPAAAPPQASVNGAQPAASPAAASPAATPQPSQADIARFADVGAPAPTPATPAPVGGQEIMPGVFSHGRGQYSDNAAGMGFASGFTGQPSAQNIAAADALAARSQQESRNRVERGFQVGGPGSGPVAPGGFTGGYSGIIGSDPRTNQARRERDQLVSALTTVIPGARGLTAAQRNGLIALRNNEQQGQIAANRDATILQQTQMSGDTQRDIAAMRESGEAQRSQASGAREDRRFNLDAQAKGFDIRQARRKEGVLQRYDAAKTDDERAALVKQFPDVFGKQDSKSLKDNFMAVGGGQEWDAQAGVMRNVPQRLVDLRTGQTVGGGAAQSSGPSGVPNIGDVRGGYRYKGGNPNNQASWEKV